MSKCKVPSPEVRRQAQSRAHLTLRDAIRRGLTYNLGGVGASNAVRQSQGQSRVARSGLLPNVSATVRENVQQTNLAAFGFRLPNAPTVVGPFNYFDLRATLTQTVADFTTLNNYRASKANAEAAAQTSEDAKDLVVFAVAGAYLQVLTTQSRITSAEAQNETARAIFTQLQEQRNAGIVAQLDVTRSQVELQTQQQRLLSLRNELGKQKINLARLVGLAPSPDIQLADDFPFTPAPELSVEQALQQARESRADLKAAEAQLRAAEHARSAARAERLPSAAFSADYGVIGRNPTDAHGTFTVVGSVRIPIWQGGRVDGDIQQASAALDQRRAELEDLRVASKEIFDRRSSIWSRRAISWRSPEATRNWRAMHSDLRGSDLTPGSPLQSKSFRRSNQSRPPPSTTPQPYLLITWPNSRWQGQWAGPRKISPASSRCLERVLHCLAMNTVRWLMLLAAFFPIRVAAAKNLEIYIIDVEGGKSVLFVSPSGESMLFDAGWPAGNGRASSTERIVEAARAAMLKQIDYLVVSHFDVDHMGDVPELVAKFPVRHLLDHGMIPTPAPDARGGATQRIAAYRAVREKLGAIVLKPGS
jgi:outer membrane protein TolC